MKIKGKDIPLGQLPSKVSQHLAYMRQSKIDDRQSARDFKQYELQKKPHDPDIVKVAFIAQMPEIWDKQMDLFRYFIEDSHFDPVILYVRQYDFVNKKISASGNNEISFYKDLHGEKYVIDFFEHRDMDLAQFDYLFYDRPYNHYLPEELQTYQTVKETRVCLVNYCTRDGGGGFGYRDFARDAYIWFASSKLEYDLHHADYKNRPYNKIFDVGYPAFETYHALVTKEGKNRILWTPRWTYEEAYGGSHFFEYIDAFIQFAKDHPDVTLTIRPHPLMFDQLIEQKAMTLEDVEQIKHRCADAGIRFDTNRIVADTFTETDILVTDYSSLIKLFLVMGKPVLYCKTNIAVNTEFEELMQAMYLSDNWDEIEKTLMDLTSGKDDLKEKREQMVSDILLRKKNAVSEIANVLLQDHKDNCG